MDTRHLFAPIVFVPALAGALLIPRSDFAEHALPDFGTADTLYTSEVIQKTGGGVLSSHTLKQALRRDAKDRLISMVSTISMPGMGSSSYTTTISWDDLDRPVLEIQDDHGDLDSTTYTWNHALCPDVAWKNFAGVIERTTWATTHTDGRCATAKEDAFMPLVGNWTPTDSLIRTWDGPRLVQELVVPPYSIWVDTLEIRRIRYDQDGRPLQSGIWKSEDDSWVLTDSCDNTYNGSVFVRQVCLDLSDNGRITTTTLSTMRPVGVSDRSPGRVHLHAWTHDGAAHFRNDDTTPLRLEILSTSGASLGSIDLAGSQTWSAHLPSGPVFWRVNSRGSTRTGILTPVR